jgi:integrase family protein with SAM-like domain
LTLTANFPLVAALADIPEEDIWLAKQKSKRTRRAYQLDVKHFMRTLMIRSYDELRHVDHRAVIAWERIMREIDGAAPSTVRRRLAALSSPGMLMLGKMSVGVFRMGTGPRIKMSRASTMNV